MADLPKTLSPSFGENQNVFKQDSARQKYILSLKQKWKQYEYFEWPNSMEIKPRDLDYYPNTPILAVYLRDKVKEHWIRFFVVNEKEFLILEMYGDMRKFPHDWFPTGEVTPDEIQDWLKRRYEHDL